MSDPSLLTAVRKERRSWSEGTTAHLVCDSAEGYRSWNKKVMSERAALSLARLREAAR